VLAAIIAATLVHLHTPQTAVTHILSFEKTPVTVTRTNVVGRYAAVLTKGGMMEGSAVSSAILAERFSFGWQPLELLNFRCRLESHELGSKINAELMRGMPQPYDDHRICAGDLKDAGPPSDVAAVRSLMFGPLVPAVVASGNWALGSWYGAGGGEDLFSKHAGRWKLVAGGGGAMGVDVMREYGVPRDDWCKFGIYDARCR
jgi:hypothetical protein